MKAAGVTIGTSRNGLRASRSPSPDTIRSAWQISMAVDGQPEEFVVSRIAARHNALGDRDRLGRSHQLLRPGFRVGDRSARQNRGAQPMNSARDTPSLRAERSNLAPVVLSRSRLLRRSAPRNDWTTFLASDLSRPPRRSTTSAATPGMDFCFSAALTRTFISRHPHPAPGSLVKFTARPLRDRVLGAEPRSAIATSSSLSCGRPLPDAEQRGMSRAVTGRLGKFDFAGLSVPHYNEVG
jgi:hypothetical protein